MPLSASIRSLAKDLPCPKSSLDRYSREPWFPPRGPSGWDLDGVRRAIEVATGRPVGPGGVAAAEHAGVQVQVSAEDRAALEGDDPIELARAATRMAAKRLAALDPASSPSKLLEDLGDALARQRITEAGYLELEVRRGDLIERDVAKACMGALARRFVLACARLEVRVAAQVELWLADAQLRALPVDDRARAVRAWVAQQTKQARLDEVGTDAGAEVERMIAAEIADRRKA